MAIAKEKLNHLIVDRLNLFGGRWRFVAAWTFAFALFFVSRDYPSLAATGIGIGLIFIGVGFRVWASQYIRKNQVLCKAGPYRISRNPLYLGTALIGLGTLFLVNSVFMNLIFAIFFFGTYWRIITDEEKNLQRIFGSEFTHYCQEVPRIIPWKLNLYFKKSTESRVSFDLKRNKSYEAVLSGLGLLALIFASIFVHQYFGLKF